MIILHLKVHPQRVIENLQVEKGGCSFVENNQKILIADAIKPRSFQTLRAARLTSKDPHSVEGPLRFWTSIIHEWQYT